MNTQPLVVPVFAVEQAIMALKMAQCAAPDPEAQQALEVLVKIEAEGPRAMPPEAYEALYAGLAG